MRALYPVRYFPTLTETFIRDEVEGMAQAGCAVTVASLGRRADGALADPLPGVPVVEVPRRPLLGRVQPSTAAQRQLARWQRPKDAQRLPWLRRLASDFDLLAVHFAGEAAEFAWAIRQDGGPPYVVTVHAVDLFKPRPSIARVLADAGAVLTVAEHHQRALADRYGIAASLVRCGPVLDRFAHLPPPPSGPLRALFIGRDVPKKGLDTLFEAWDGAPAGAELRVVSDRTGGGLPPGVRLLGLQPRGAVVEHLGWCNLVIAPCREAPDGDLDGVPVVLMEALAAGRPVLTTPVSGIPELVDAAVGWLVPPDDPGALRAALDTITEEEISRRGSRGPARLRNRGYTRDTQVTLAQRAWNGCCGL